MVTRDSAWPAGTPCWMDLQVPDLARAKTFYSRLFGWNCPEGPPEAGGYSVCEVGGRAVAGLGPQMSPDSPTAWITYLATDDADQTAAKIKGAGGQMLSEPFDILDVGRMGMASDPGGAVFGIWQARAHTGIRLANEPGSVVWNENMSRNFDGNKAFYHAVFGYQYGDIGAETYATMDLDGGPVGGIGAIGPEQPADKTASWGTYFAVRDADAAVAKVTELGGSVVAPAWDSPYGRMAVVSDDQGAVFALMSVTEPEG